MHEIWTDAPVDRNQNLWRYFRPERLVSALDQRTLYFASAREFNDPFEGATAIVAPQPVDPRFEELGRSDRAFEELRRLTKISCWNRGDHESEAMWKLYGSERKGVALRTTAERLVNSLHPFRLRADYGEEEPVWGIVRYVDLTRARLRVQMLERFFSKHVAFSTEEELRVAISLRMAEEFGVSVPEKGIAVGFDPDVLVSGIVLGPDLAGPDKEVVCAAVHRAGLGQLIGESTLLWRPRYT